MLVSPQLNDDHRSAAGARQRLNELVARSRRSILLERGWPFVWLPTTVLLAFLSASWLGLWVELPVWARQAGLAVFATLFVLSLLPILRVRVPHRSEVLDRLDREAGTSNRPARSFADTLATGDGDAGSRALWALHLARVERAVAGMAPARPQADMPRRDRYALRGLALVATAACAFVAGPDAASRLGAAFDWRGGGPGAPAFRIDGWIDPPHYTRLPPLMIDLAGGQQRLKAPVGSTVVIRIAGKGDADIRPGPGLKPLSEASKGQEAPTATLSHTDLRQQRFSLVATSDIEVKTGLASTVRLTVEAVPDTPPEVALSGPPDVNERGAFTLAYRMKDDYGIASGEAVMSPLTEGRRTLVPPPRIPLTLPTDPRAGEETKSLAELSDHPWAGARVRLSVMARDDAGQEGASAPVEFTLPQRPFTVPLAKALVEQRRNLILDPDRRRPVQTALDALLIAPEMFTPQWGVFMGLKAASTRLRQAKTDAELTDVAELLWAMALQIEEGDLSAAERELRAAQDRLREAMERGASDEEIRKLTDQLKQAMDRFLREFAQRMEKDRQNGDRNARAPDRVISEGDLNRMLNEMAEAMKRGDTAEAQRLLDQLKNILDNLRTAQPGSRMSDPQSREMNRQMDELDRMARDQQQLRDETFQDGQRSGRSPGERRERADRGGRQGERNGETQRGERGQRGQGQRGQRGQGQEGQGDEQADGGEGEDGQSGTGGLGQRQGELRRRLGEVQRRMRGLGMQGEQGLTDAEDAMREAENAIDQGQGGRAVDSQGRALEGLRRGMQGMAQQMQQMLGQGDDPGEDGDPNGPGNPTGRANNDPRSDDPLGRPQRSREFSDGRVKVPGADESATERARRILEELRRKLGDPSRPAEELDYFERLLRQRN